MSDDASASLWRGPTLVLDAATAVVHVGILRDGEWAELIAPQGEALETIFAAVEAVLKTTGLSLPDLQCLALGTGPGSILGLRLSLMALRTWQQLPLARDWQIFQFRGLEVYGRLLAAQRPGESFNLISNFRRGSWHHLPIVEGTVGTLAILKDTEVTTLSGETYYIPAGRSLLNPPVVYTEATFSLEDLPTLFPQFWATPTTAPELYLPDPPSFKTWTAERHR